MATFGNTAPSSNTINYDAVFATSLAKYRKTLIDQISLSNALFYELKQRGMWQEEGGSAWLTENLVYSLGTADSYDGYDELPDGVTDGITQAVYEWRQASVPVSYNEKERKMNKEKIVDLVETKIMQAEEGFIDYFNKAILQGQLATNPSGDFRLPRVSPANGSYSIDPIWNFIDPTPTVSRVVGNINQGTYSWWRNRVKTCTATTGDNFLLELDNLLNTCNIGKKGKKNSAVMITDQITYELINAAYFKRFRTMAASKGDYPFENIEFRGNTITWDESMIDVYSSVANTDTYGTLLILRPDDLKVKVESETNMEMTKFAKPIKGDSRLAHILWMGQMTCRQRRRLGVYQKIPRTLTLT